MQIGTANFGNNAIGVRCFSIYYLRTTIALTSAGNHAGMKNVDRLFRVWVEGVISRCSVPFCIPLQMKRSCQSIRQRIALLQLTRLGELSIRFGISPH